jgi:hypothetical protein
MGECVSSTFANANATEIGRSDIITTENKDKIKIEVEVAILEMITKTNDVEAAITNVKNNIIIIGNIIESTEKPENALIYLRTILGRYEVAIENAAESVNELFQKLEVARNFVNVVSKMPLASAQHNIVQTTFVKLFLMQSHRDELLSSLKEQTNKIRNFIATFR